MLTTKERTSDLRELEELWEAPVFAPEQPARRRGARDVAVRLHGRWIALGWAVFLTTAFIFEPAPDPQAVTPAWANLVVSGLFLSLAAAALMGMSAARGGFAAATVAGVFGMAVAVGCHTSGHHLGNWWLVELGATGALTALAATGLVARLRR